MIWLVISSGYLQVSSGKIKLKFVQKTNEEGASKESANAEWG